MCGRLAISLPKEAMTELFQATPANDLPQTPNYNVCPTDNIHTVTSDQGTRHLRAMRWGFVPSWYATLSGGPLLINARSETITEKPAFRDACQSRRCLIPADGFYEWARNAGEKPIPYRVLKSDEQPMAMAGIWQNCEIDGSIIATCAIVTTGANKTMGKIHHRLPVIIGPEDWPLWLGEAGKGAANLMQPVAEYVLDLQRVSTAVNSSRASGPKLWEKV
ncbi:MAG: SOS response-associated peptidase [Planktomarina sp.]|jgi:putative SOS response-associated peptidase YedK|nr:SOS response-associated peptidase [Planktomarina sp.]|tara:strand:- start:212 stop:871 length:660 start_codon:yes stop_codon:yes gene_type:complete